MTHAVKTVIRLIAAGIFVIAGMTMVLEFLRGWRQENWGFWRLALSIAGVVLGAVLFFSSSAIANRVTDDADDNIDDSPTDE